MPAAKAISRMPSIDRIMDYEEGKLDQEQVAELFQELIDNNMIWNLQGSYQRMAQTLINDGLCTPKA